MKLRQDDGQVVPSSRPDWATQKSNLKCVCVCVLYVSAEICVCMLDYTHVLYMCACVIIYIYICTYTYNLIKIFMDPELTNTFINEFSAQSVLAKVPSFHYI